MCSSDARPSGDLAGVSGFELVYGHVSFDVVVLDDSGVVLDQRQMLDHHVPSKVPLDVIFSRFELFSHFPYVEKEPSKDLCFLCWQKKRSGYESH